MRQRVTLTFRKINLKFDIPALVPKEFVGVDGLEVQFNPLHYVVVHIHTTGNPCWR